MNPEEDRLEALLKSWQVPARPAPDFEAAVWARIRARKPEGLESFWAAVRAGLETLFARPAVAFSYLALITILGWGAGYVRAETRAAQTRAELAQRYLHLIDPYQPAASR